MHELTEVSPLSNKQIFFENDQLFHKDHIYVTNYLMNSSFKFFEII